ncbi:MAG: ATP-binding protein [Planctomycetota bacterium]|nr:MAG: ATP-binding protein [Planctomycetota bacterium]
MSELESVLEALRGVLAPGCEQSIVELGYVKGVDGKRIRVEFPAPLTPARRAVADRCRELLPEFEVALESKIPSSFTGEGGGALAGVRNVVAVGSGKGGVGKSTVAVNLAVGLARAGARVGLLDTDVYGPSVPLLMGVSRQAFLERLELEPPAPGGQPRLTPHRAHDVLTLSLGYLVDPDKAAMWRGPMVHGAIMQLLNECEWGELDYLILDMPPGTGDVQLTLSQNVPLAGAVLVCTPQPVALADARKAVNLFRTTHTEVLGLVENMAYHACSACGHADDIFGRRGGQDAAEEWGLPFLGSLPLDTRVRVSGDEGRPLLAGDEPSPLADALWGVIDRLTAVLAARVRSRPRSLPITRS